MQFYNRTITCRFKELCFINHTLLVVNTINSVYSIFFAETAGGETLTVSTRCTNGGVDLGRNRQSTLDPALFIVVFPLVVLICFTYLIYLAHCYITNIFCKYC